MDIDTAAHLMGMKPHREVLSVVETADGHVVGTHDGQFTLIRPDGKMQFHVPAPEQAAEAEPAEEEPAGEQKPKPAKAAKASARRGKAS